MVIPSQALIVCKGCGERKEPHPKRILYCSDCMRKMQVDYQRAYRKRQASVSRIIECRGCGQQFSTKGRGKTWRCQPCTTAYQAELRQMDKERHAEYSRKYRAGLGDAYKVKMMQRRRDLIASLSPDELIAFRKLEADKARRLSAKLRDEVFEAYGGRKCACCGETEPLFLSIDHIDNDGAEMRKNGTHSRGGTAFYQWLRKSGFPKDFQVLCMNCNTGKHRNGGACPHQSKKV